MSLFYEEMLKNPNLLVTLAFSGSDSVPAFTVSSLISDDFGVNTQTQWNHNDASVSDNGLQTVANVIAGMTGDAKRSMSTLVGTLSDWSGNSKPTFTIPLVLPKYSKSAPGLDIASTMLAMCAPSYNKGVLVAPGGYYRGNAITQVYGQIQDAANGLIELANDALEAVGSTSAIPTVGAGSDMGYADILSQLKGTWSIQIGNWFRATHLVLDNVNFSGSKEVVTGGVPLVVNVSASFTPVIQPSAKTVKGWFIADNDTSVFKDTDIAIATQGETPSANGNTTPAEA